MTKAGKRSQRSVDVVALRDVLGSLDNAHGELVYSMLYLRYIQTGVFEQVDLVKARKYRKLCFCFFKKTGQMLPVLADYTCVLLAGLASKEIAEGGRHTCYDEAEKMIWRLAMRHIRKAQATPLANLLNRAYSQHVSVHDIGETARTVIPVVRETACLVNKEDYHLAVGNLTVLFRVLHKLFVWHPEMFAETRQDVGCSLELILEMTRGLFCTMRGMGGLPADIAEEMDCIAVVRNARYNNFLGAWDSAEFKDMVCGAGQQSRDYDLEDTWPAFSLLQNETSITR